jgi:hypothetical protein
MIDEEELAMALCNVGLGSKQCPCAEAKSYGCRGNIPGQIARAAIAYIVPREREECAKVVSDMPWASVETIAAAIRNMDTQP